MTLHDALTILAEIALEPIGDVRRVTPEVAKMREALALVQAHGAHPVSCSEFDRISQWSFDYRPLPLLDFHLERICMAIAGEDVLRRRGAVVDR